MIHRLLRTAIVGVVVALLIGACEQGPGSPRNQPNSPSNEDANNVTRTFTIRSSQFQVTDISGLGYAGIGFSFPEIDSEVVRKGLVHAHMRTNSPGDDTWVTLPFSITIGVSPTVTLDLTYGFSQGEVGFAIYSNVPASILRTALSDVDGWKMRVAVDPS